MKSLTIHNLDEELSSKIQEKAEGEGKSLNRTIKEILAQALHITSDKKKDIDDFQEFLGIWSEDEFQEFQEKMEGFNQVDQEDWQ